MKFRVNADVYFAMTIEEVIDADSEQAAEEQLEQKIREARSKDQVNISNDEE